MNSRRPIRSHSPKRDQQQDRESCTGGVNYKLAKTELCQKAFPRRDQRAGCKGPCDFSPAGQAWIKDLTSQLTVPCQHLPLLSPEEKAG